MAVEIHFPRDLEKRYWKRLREHSVLDAWASKSGQRVTTDALELPPEATGAALVVSAEANTSSVVLEGSSDGGESWERLVSRSSVSGLYVLLYAHDPAPMKRLTHLRVMVDMWSKGAVRVGLEVLML